MIELRPTREEDARVFFNGRPSQSMMGVSLVDNGIVVGMVGVYIVLNSFHLFIEKNAELKYYKRHLIKGARMIFSMLDGYMIPVYATIGKEDGAELMLRHFGFKPYRGEVYIRG